MSPHLIYQIAVILFLFSMAVLTFLFIVRYIKKSKSHESKKQKVSSRQEKTSVGLVDVPESDILNRNTKSTGSLRDIINDIEGFNQTDRYPNNGFIQRYWEDQFPYLHTELKIDKILMVKVLSNDAYKIERYNHFSISTLNYLEEQLNKRSSVLNGLIQKKKNLYFSGPVRMSGAFSPLFDESDKNKFYQLYIFPIIAHEQVIGILFFIKDDEKQIPPSELKPLLLKGETL
ncbi:MAG: hypothetical protein IEMM0008_0393 [bacterium]|nr:MAG: hypothetical protein IEMM0008_0393 [bacterium]